MTPSYLITEIYPCLQGEGVNLGKPSLLVRFQICNLRCTWCDTPYTHTIKSDNEFYRISLPLLVEKIQSYTQTHLILTGGEPTLQNIGALMRALLKNKPSYTFEVESNGTRIPHINLPGFLESDYSLAQWNISPKFSNAGEKINHDALEHWSNLSNANDSVYFKFVVRQTFLKEDINEILNLTQTYQLKSNKIILMPEGVETQSQINNKELHDACLKYHFRYSPRLHILLFGNTRGT